MEILKMLLTILSGGACGALINEFLHRRKARMQPIPLIERVNRLVSSGLKGFVLARRIGTDNKDGDLEVIQRVREYQFTLRNSSYIHLHNAEVQFEFPSKDVEGRAERPGRSKTTPIQLDAEISEPWKAGYRWRVPELPPGDSIDFTFRAVDPSSDEYEVALYNCGQVVIEKSKGEPAAKRLNLIGKPEIIFYTFIVAFVAFFGFVMFKSIADRGRQEVTVIDWAGCNLNVTTSSYLVNSKLFSFSQSKTWSVISDVTNTGTQKCFLKWESSSEDGFTVDSGSSDVVYSGYMNTKPILAPVKLLFGPDAPGNKATVMLYQRVKP